MRSIAALLALFAALVPAAASNADPAAAEEAGAASPAFLASLQKAGISYGDPDRAVAAAQAVCGMVDNGKNGLEVLSALMSENPGFTTDGAAHFAALAANAYCPHQLASDSDAKAK